MCEFGTHECRADLEISSSIEIPDSSGVLVEYPNRCMLVMHEIATPCLIRQRMYLVYACTQVVINIFNRLM